jgi:ribosome-associated toxin RatA of RatAB toxin-antitoxin module
MQFKHMLLKLRLYLPALILLTHLFSVSLSAQSWDLVKEQDGIKVYTRCEAGKTLKSYKGATVIKAPAEKVFSLIEDIRHTEWWGPGFSQIKVLSYEKNKRAQCYLVYDSPWPVSKRDLFVDVTVNIDPARSIYTVRSVPFTSAVPQPRDMVRIRNYSQTWTISPAGVNQANVVLEGYVDPAGNIPVLISNVLATQAPLNTILGIRKLAEER